MQMGWQVSSQSDDRALAAAGPMKGGPAFSSQLGGSVPLRGTDPR